MSIRVRDVCTHLLKQQGYSRFGLSFIFKNQGVGGQSLLGDYLGAIEAAPFYAELEMQYTASGTYASGLLTYEYILDESAVWTRVPARTTTALGYGYGPNNGTATFNLDTGTSYASDTCAFVHTREAYNLRGEAGEYHDAKNHSFRCIGRNTTRANVPLYRYWRTDGSDPTITTVTTSVTLAPDQIWINAFSVDPASNRIKPDKVQYAEWNTTFGDMPSITNPRDLRGIWFEVTRLLGSGDGTVTEKRRWRFL